MRNFFLFFCCFLPVSVTASELSLSIDQEALGVIYSGGETLHYSLSWSGGIKIGDLYLSVVSEESGDGFVITARVTDYGLFKFFYPVDDTFTTFVRGPLKLPYRYEVHQLEGSDMDARRLTLYDQEHLSVVYRKNDNSQITYTLDGSAYNEFSSFFITRALDLILGESRIVPTFVDGKRHEVAVDVLGLEARKTMFGRVKTIKVLPKMSFKGLYDKDGDTVFWLTDDVCRIPVEIDSKILIGSLVAELVEYSNHACSLKKKEKTLLFPEEEDLVVITVIPGAAAAMSAEPMLTITPKEPWLSISSIMEEKSLSGVGWVPGCCKTIPTTRNCRRL